MATAAVLAAGAGIALIDHLSSKGQSNTVTNSVISRMTINANFSSETSCFQSANIDQKIDVKAPNDSYPSKKLQNGACDVCHNMYTKIKGERDKLEEELWKRDRTYTMQQWPNYDDLELGECDLVCIDIVTSNILQTANLKFDANCTNEATVKNSLNQSINGQVSAFLKNQEDFLGQLGDAFTSNTNSITNSLSHAMGQTIGTDERNILKSRIDISQKITFDNSHSVFADQLKQSFTAESISTMDVHTKLTNSLRQSSDYSIIQQLLNKNDTIGDLSGDFTRIIQTWSSLIESLTGQILLIVGSILMIVFLVGGSLYCFNKRFRNTVDKKFERFSAEAVVAPKAVPS
jgi:hypothetical protein